MKFSLDFFSIFLSPTVLWILLMGTLVTLTCGSVGIYLNLRKMTLIGDAMSHSLLPGITLSFLISGSRSTFPMFIGGLLAGFLTNILIDSIRSYSPIKIDAAIAIVFSFLFSIGIILISLFTNHVDIDVDCVLYGEIGFVSLSPFFSLWDTPIMPLPILRILFVLIINSTLIFLFYKELLLTSFDNHYAKSLGLRTKSIHYILVSMLSFGILSAFEAVGSILTITMLIFPTATALLLTDHLPKLFIYVSSFSILYAVFGYLIAYFLDASIAGSMGIAAGIIFLLAWLFTPKNGLFQQWIFKKKVQ